LGVVVYYGKGRKKLLIKKKKTTLRGREISWTPGEAGEKLSEWGGGEKYLGRRNRTWRLLAKLGELVIGKKGSVCGVGCEWLGKKKRKRRRGIFWGGRRINVG